MKRFQLLQIALLAVFFISLVSCGSGSGTSADSASTDGTTFGGASAKNEEIFLGVIGADKSSTLAKSLAATVNATSKILEVPWTSQLLSGQTWEMNNKNCGPATFLMVDSYYHKYHLDSSNYEVNIKNIIDYMAINYSGEPYYYVPAGNKNTIQYYLGDYTGDDTMQALLKDKGGFDCIKITTDGLNGVEDEINNNYPVIVWAAAQGSNTTDTMKNGEDHWMLVVGYDQKYIYVNDPGRTAASQGSRRAYTRDSFEYVWNLKSKKLGYSVRLKGNSLPLAMSEKSLSMCPTLTVGKWYLQELAAINGSAPYTWSIAHGSLPDGLNLSPGGTISGTPTKAGSFVFSVKVTDSSSQSVIRETAINVAATQGNDSIIITTPQELPAARVNHYYYCKLTSIGSILQCLWNLITGKLPDGLSLNYKGEIYGTPSNSGKYIFSISAGNNSANKDIAYKVNYATASVISKEFSILVQPDQIVIPVIAQTPMSAKQGDTISQWGTGFSPDSTALLHFKKPDGTEFNPLVQSIKSDGSFSIPYQIPLDRAPGTYTWWGIDTLTGKTSNSVSYIVVSANAAPIAEASVSTSTSGPFWGYGNPLVVTKGQSISLFFFADKDVNGDSKASLDPNGWTDSENGVSSGGKTEWNTDLNQGAPTFEKTIYNPSSAGSANIGPFTYTFNDSPGTYEYQLLRITDRKGAQSNTSKIKVTVVDGTGGVYGKLHASSATGLPLSGATVVCGNKSTTTGSDGSFSLTGVTSGTQILSFSKTGHESYSVSITITSGTSYNAGDRWLVPNTPEYEGWIDNADCSSISGWAWDKNQANTPISVDIYDGSSKVATVLSNIYRQDLLNAGKGNGSHGFNYSTPSTLKDGKSHSLSVKYAGTNISLSGSPKSFVCAGYASVSQGVAISANPVVLGNNFKISFTLKEVRGAAKTFDNLAIRVTDPNGGWFDFNIFPAVTIPANGTKSFEYTNYIYTTRPTGTYQADIRGKIGDTWFVFDTVDSGVNPKSFTVRKY